MGKVIHDIVETTFSKKNTSQYKLSILVGVGSFHYLVTDANGAVLVVKGHQMDEYAGATEWGGLLRLDPTLRYIYKEVYVAWAGEKTTLVPKRLHQREESRVYLQQTSPVASHEQVKHDALSDLTNVYALPKGLSEFLGAHFPNCRIWHLGSVLLETISRSSTTPQLYAHLAGNTLFTIAYTQGRLQFYNTFVYRSAKDFIYFLLLVFKQTELSQTETAVHLSGQLMEDSEIYRLVQRYVPQAVFQSPPDGIDIGEKGAGLPAHLYYGLFCLARPGVSAG